MIKIATLSSDWAQNSYRERHNLYGAIAYYRLVKPYQELEKKYKDIKVDFYNRELCDLQRGTKPEVFWDDFTKKYDIIITKAVDNGPAGAMITYFCQKNGTKLVIDLDDNYFEVDKDNPAGADYGPGSEKRCIFSAYLSLANAIITSTDNLQRYYSQHIKKVFKEDKPVYQFPNLNDVNDWKESSQEDGKIIIGWAGSITHDKDLKMVMPAINLLMKQYPNLYFEIVGGLQPETVAEIFSDLEDVNRLITTTGTKAWNSKDKSYPDLMAERKWDIALAPLVDTKFNRARSNIKWLEFSMNKIPTVCSNTEPYKSIPDELAYKCLDGLDFYKKLKYLIDNPKERKEMGEKSYQYIKDNLQWSNNVDKLNEIIRKIYGI